MSQCRTVRPNTKVLVDIMDKDGAKVEDVSVYACVCRSTIEEKRNSGADFTVSLRLDNVSVRDYERYKLIEQAFAGSSFHKKH